MTTPVGDGSEEARPARLATWLSVQHLVSLGVALVCAAFVVIQMRPGLLLADTTPAGGDMGAHVWGPAFLRDHVLTHWRLSGWTPDWYAGFPAYQYYMVAPALVIVAVNLGFRPLVALPLAVVLLAVAAVVSRRWPRHRTAILITTAVVALLLFSVPYGIAFKLVTIVGLVAMPITAWAMARMLRSPEPIPAFAALAATVFLFDTNFEITGGNVLSTLAGEFCFAISLAAALLAIGLAARGMDTGRHRLAPALVIALVALSHIIPVFFMIVALVALVGLDRGVPRLWPLMVMVALALVPVGMADNSSFTTRVLALGAAAITLALLLVSDGKARARAGWLVTVGPVSVLLASIWLLPFVLRHQYFNDMGWERLTVFGPKLLTLPMKVALPVAAVGLVLSIAQRERLGLVFATTGLVAASAVVNLPAGALWNERLLPFYYLSVYLLAGVGVALVLRLAAALVANDLARPSGSVVLGATVACLVATLVAISLPLQVLPFGRLGSDNAYHWLAFTSRAKSKQPSWTAWNYSGYERKPAYREYHEIVATMANLGQTNGCGRAMWEYSKDLDRYGTPMALMLLPFWTDSCIGSMEGLYFESSATTPFHFLNQSVLSESPSRAQRDLPYQGFNLDKGVAQLQVMGVRYYMAQSDSAIEAARKDPLLTEVAQAPPFVVFQVAGSDLVQGLAYQPVVASGQTAEAAGPKASRFDQGWLGEAVRYYNNPASFGAMPAADGPASWPRITTLVPGDGEPITPAKVTNIRSDTQSISFDVDQVGSPVLVKASYFPNWQAKGADGPWRIGPNLMVVVPRSQQVSLSYGRTGVDWLATFAALLGLAGLALLVRSDRRRPLLILDEPSPPPPPLVVAAGPDPGAQATAEAPEVGSDDSDDSDGGIGPVPGDPGTVPAEEPVPGRVAGPIPVGVVAGGTGGTGGTERPPLDAARATGAWSVDPEVAAPGEPGGPDTGNGSHGGNGSHLGNGTSGPEPAAVVPVGNGSGANGHEGPTPEPAGDGGGAPEEGTGEEGPHRQPAEVRLSTEVGGDAAAP